MPVQESLTDTAMGTVIHMKVYQEEQEGEESLCQELLNLVRSYEKDTLSWREAGSLTAMVNEAGKLGKWQQVTGEYAGLLERSREVWKDSEGAFDVTLGELTRLWDLDRKAAQEGDDPEIPCEEEIRDALLRCGGEGLWIAGESVFLQEGCSLDLGSIGKGAALDQIQAYLMEMEPKDRPVGGVFSLGGSVMTYGNKPDATPWKIAITDPCHPDAYIGSLELEGQWFVATSGDYERYVEVEGVRYHHILDPATGYPVQSGVHSVTILSKSGFLSDALSTACFVLGVEKGMELAKKYGVGVLFVDEKGQLLMNEEIQGYFREYESGGNR